MVKSVLVKQAYMVRAKVTANVAPITAIVLPGVYWTTIIQIGTEKKAVKAPSRQKLIGTCLERERQQHSNINSIVMAPTKNGIEAAGGTDYSHILDSC